MKMSILSVITFTIAVSIGCTKVRDKAVELEKQASAKVEESKAKADEIMESANEIGQYSDCIIEADTEEKTKKCEEIKAKFSAFTKERLEKIRKDRLEN